MPPRDQRIQGRRERKKLWISFKGKGEAGLPSPAEGMAARHRVPFFCPDTERVRFLGGNPASPADGDRKGTAPSPAEVFSLRAAEERSVNRMSFLFTATLG